jgi:glycosyltransferase involved in cell wall biosynthesis
MMNQESVVLFRDFLEDNRTSMEIYSDKLESTLKPIAKNFININSYTPSISNWLSKYKLPFGISMRYARYFSYPNQAKKNQGKINHIIDQSYAHLLNTINSRQTVITVHDLIPLLAWKGVIPGLEYPHFPLLYKLSIASLNKAKAIIAISKSTKEDLITYCGLDASSITVIHAGVDKRFGPFSNEKKKLARHSLGFLEKDTYIILIVGFQSYKNILVSFQVVSKLQHSLNANVQLIWLGSNKDMCTKYSKRVNLINNAIPLSNLGFNSLVELYNSVDCLLFPSLYEGFGSPPLEAMACGTPVITSNVASIPEVVGDAAIMLSPSDVGGLAEAVKNILENETLRNDYIKRGYTNAKRFTWERSASKVFSLYQKILNEKF